MFFIEKEVVNYIIWESSGIVSKLEDGIVTIKGLNNILAGECNERKNDVFLVYRSVLLLNYLIL